MRAFIHNDFSFNNQDLFSNLPNKLIKLLKSNTSLIKFKAEDKIFIEGEKPKGIYRVRTGMVKKLTQTSFGSSHIFYICSPREFLGYHAIFSEESYVDTAIALLDSEIEFIPKEFFIKAVNTSNNFQKRLLKSLSHEFRVFVNASKILAKYTVRERTALNLLILEDKFRPSNQNQTEIFIHRDDLASMVGTAKESVVRTLKEFKEERLISTRGSTIFIDNYDGLIKASYINR